MHFILSCLSFLFHHPVVGFIVLGLLALAMLVAVHRAPDIIGEKVDARSAEAFKQKQPIWARNERLRQIKDEGRREDEVLARWAKPKKRAARMMNSPNPKRALKGQRAMQEADHWMRRDMRTVHHAARSATVHPSGKINRGIRRD